MDGSHRVVLPWKKAKRVGLMHLETNPKDHFTRTSKKAVPIRLMTRRDFADSKGDLSKTAVNWAKANGFSGETGQVCLIADENGQLNEVLFGLGGGSGERKSLIHGKLARTLPEGKYTLCGSVLDTALAQLAWAMGGYSFDRYRSRKHKTPQLAGPTDNGQMIAAQAVFLARDLINTPAGDMGPDALEKAFRKLAKTHQAKVTCIAGDKLLTKNFPMVHAVGRASAVAPRVLDMSWGKASHPKVTLVGKGVTFDTGGLNIKPGQSMALMKKDMGGAANVMGLAHMIMAAKLPVRLRLIVGAVENAISGNAFRPGDILQTRNGMTVEIGNTDAEGRLVLGDCLTLGDEDKPDMMIDMATLTGAARVALGPDLPPFYTHDPEFAASLKEAAEKVSDPLWHMPLWDPYTSMLSSKTADINHISTGGHAGSITAALFLDQFVKNAKTWAHLDIFGWAPTEQSWASVGGEAQGIRALYQVITQRYGK